MRFPSVNDNNFRSVLDIDGKMEFQPPAGSYYLRHLQTGDGNALASSRGSRGGGDSMSNKQPVLFVSILGIIMLCASICALCMSRRVDHRIEEQEKVEKENEKENRQKMVESIDSRKVIMVSLKNGCF
jgi:hypothetical protein